MTDTQNDGHPASSRRDLLVILVAVVLFGFAMWRVRDRLGSVFLLSAGVVVAVVGGVGALAASRRSAKGWLAITLAVGVLGVGLVVVGGVGIVRG